MQITDRRQIFSDSITTKGVLDFIEGFDVEKRTSRLREIVVYFHNHIKLFDTQFLETKDISSLCENFYLDYKNKYNVK